MYIYIGCWLFNIRKVLGWKGSFFNLPPEVLMFCNQAFIFENLYLKKKIRPGSMQLDPWI